MTKELVSPGLMLTSIIGFMISATYTVTGKMGEWFMPWGDNTGISFGFSFCLVFVIMFIASIIRMTPTYKELKE